MSSVISGYNFDIFISYRQKDNEYDGWVTELVDNLNKEIKATFKEDISIYFDSNPVVGLTETNDVDLSIREKIKSLIFIPILSHTYCDENCFAWKNEFIAFRDFAQTDKFGLDIPLLNGNVSKRVIPIKIHEIIDDDISLFEKETGGVLRPIEFIFKSSGVNRPLRAKEEHIDDNLNNTIYRDQINKVANAIKEIIVAMKIANSESGKTLVNVPKSNEEVTVKANFKSKKDGSITKRSNNINYQKPTLILLAISIILTLGFFGYKWFSNHLKIKEVNEIILPEIRYLLDSTESKWKAVNLIYEAEKYISNNETLNDYKNRLSQINIESSPFGANVYGKRYSDNEAQWIYIGKTPLKNVGVPNMSSQLKFELENYATSVIPLYARNLRRGKVSLKLFKKSDTPEEMVLIQGDTFQISLVGFDHLPKKYIGDFWIDKYEITNKQFKEFIDQDGYKKKQFWRYPIVNENSEVVFEDVTEIFKDKTGMPGPSGWEAGSYPDGQGDYPVGGISWYEAAAYAEFVGKQLPTIYHWNKSAYIWSSGDVVPASNIKSNAPIAVGKSGSLNAYGTYDQSGNVREWVFNRESSTGDRFILGGGWNDAAYAFTDAYSLPPINRSKTNGFRCMIPIDSLGLKITKNQLENPTRDFSVEDPIDRPTFKLLIRQYSYDKFEVNPKVIYSDSSNQFWIKQKIKIKAAYSEDTLLFYMYLPKKVKQPYQTVIFFPGDGGFYNPSSEDSYIPDFILKSGRALITPVLKGTFERRSEMTSSMPNLTNQYKEHVIMWSKDINRLVDYLEFRGDIDLNKLAFFGYSWGGRMGPIMMYNEKRIKIGILSVAGLRSQVCQPEVDPFNFVPRVKIPILMLNGEFDFYFPLETSQRPMYENFGTPKEHKVWKVYNGSHNVPRTELAKESIAWLRKYFGDVN